MSRLLRLSLALAVGLAFASPALSGINRWTRNGPEGGTVRTLAVDPVTPGTVYLGLDRGQPSLWKSASAAASWAPTASLGREAIFQIETDPTSPRTLYAATASS